MGVYSFLNVNCTILGPGGSFNMASGAQAAEEGITIEAHEDKNIMTIGADGSGMHSLVASDAKKVTVRLLKTSPVNNQLQLMYNIQTASSALHGANVITTTDPVRGDLIILQACAFSKQPTVTYAKEGGMMEWTFDVIKGDVILGAG